jgi:hypothetical protein
MILVGDIPYNDIDRLLKRVPADLVKVDAWKPI